MIRNKSGNHRRLVGGVSECLQAVQGTRETLFPERFSVVCARAVAAAAPVAVRSESSADDVVESTVADFSQLAAVLHLSPCSSGSSSSEVPMISPCMILSQKATATTRRRLLPRMGPLATRAAIPTAVMLENCMSGR